MKTYNISNNSVFVIYGATHSGRNVKAALNNQGYKIKCFLDEKFNKIKEIDELVVCNPECFDDDDYIYVITKSNPCSFANELYKKGITKIIFNPYLYKISENNYFKEMVNAFFMIEGVIDKDFNIPCYNPKYMDNRFVNMSLINSFENESLIYIPTDLLFEIDSNQHIYIEYADLLESIREIDGYRGDFSALANYVEGDSLTRLTGRRFDRISDKLRFVQETFNCYTLRMCNGLDWFINNPIRISFDSNKFYIEKEDVLKTLFLVVKGFIRVPALINSDDYVYWINEDKLLGVINYAKSEKMLISYTPLEHPYFYNYPIARDVGGNSRIMLICKWLNEEKIDVKDKLVMDFGAYYGFFSRFFSRLGAKVDLMEANKKSYEFCGLFNDLMRISDITMYYGEIEKNDTLKKYDICLLLTVLYWYYKDEIGLKILEAVDRMTSRFLIWESGEEAEEEKAWIMRNSSFSSYRKIAKTFGTGKIRELGVFMK